MLGRRILVGKPGLSGRGTSPGSVVHCAIHLNAAKQVSDNENVHHRQTYGGIPVSHPEILTLGVDGRTNNGSSFRASVRWATHGLSVTLFVTALVRWATGKRLTGRLPKLSLIMTVAHLFPADERLKNNGHQVLLCSYVPGIYQVYAGSSISPETC